MTLLKRLQAHRGGLLRLRTRIYWYDSRHWDKYPGRTCLILDAASRSAFTVDAVTAATATAAIIVSGPQLFATPAALLLIDGQSRWIWVSERDIEVIDEAR